MTAITVSPKFQVVIPKEIRDNMKIRPGQKLQVFQIGDRIEMVPECNVKELRGLAKGIDTNVPRDGDRV